MGLDRAEIALDELRLEQCKLERAFKRADEESPLPCQPACFVSLAAGTTLNYARGGVQDARSTA
ncbi:hypothetical protein VN12_16445 [Pirellula sp. SH-Sr6A]|nr:hypothetical protein VN12_16445 [Pirellula sp. SH-Sr6A]